MDTNPVIEEMKRPIRITIASPFSASLFFVLPCQSFASLARMLRMYVPKIEIGCPKTAHTASHPLNEKAARVNERLKFNCAVMLSAVLAQFPQRAHAKRQKHTSTRNHRRGLGNGFDGESERVISILNIIGIGGV